MIISTNNIQEEIRIEILPEHTIYCDMDGTLIDTDYANYLSYINAIKDVTRQKYDIQFNSRKRLNRKLLKEKIPNLTDNQFNAIVSLKTNYYSKYLAETKVNTPLAEFIRKCVRTNDAILVTCCREKRALKRCSITICRGAFLD